jgi:hypothetical protein
MTPDQGCEAEDAEGRRPNTADNGRPLADAFTNLGCTRPASTSLGMAARLAAVNGPTISSTVGSAAALSSLGMAARLAAVNGPTISSTVGIYESPPRLWTPLETGLIDVGPGLGEVWVEYSRELGLWLVRPGVKVAGIATAIYLFTAWYLSFKAAHAQAAEEFKDIILGVFFLLLGLWATAGRAAK